MLRLQRIHLCVLRFVFHQFFMRTDLADLSVLEADDSVRHTGGREPMRYIDRRFARGDLVKLAEQLIFRSRVQRGRGLIQYEYFGIFEH